MIALMARPVSRGYLTPEIGCSWLVVSEWAGVEEAVGAVEG
jgi:hypothetical protein